MNQLPSSGLSERTRLVSGPKRERRAAVLRRTAVDSSCGAAEAAGSRCSTRGPRQPSVAPDPDSSHMRCLVGGVDHYDDHRRIHQEVTLLVMACRYSPSGQSSDWLGGSFFVFLGLSERRRSSRARQARPWVVIPAPCSRSWSVARWCRAEHHCTAVPAHTGRELSGRTCLRVQADTV
jgi:hypothetical protein